MNGFSDLISKAVKCHCVYSKNSFIVLYCFPAEEKKEEKKEESEESDDDMGFGLFD